MLVAIDVFTKKVAAVPLASKTAPAAAAAWNQIVKALGVPSYVYSDDGSEFKSEFKQKLDYFDVDKVVSRGHAYFVERAIRTLKEALLRRISAGLAARNRWHQLLPDVLAQYNSRTHGGTGVAPRPSLLGSRESRTCQASHADAGEEKCSASAVSCSWRSGEGQGQASGKQRSLPSYRNSLDRTELPYHSNRTFRHGSAVHSGRVAQRQASRSRPAESGSCRSLRA